jgi:hypothetical protein
LRDSCVEYARLLSFVSAALQALQNFRLPVRKSATKLNHHHLENVLVSTILFYLDSRMLPAVRGLLSCCGLFLQLGILLLPALVVRIQPFDDLLIRRALLQQILESRLDDLGGWTFQVSDEGRWL